MANALLPKALIIVTFFCALGVNVALGRTSDVTDKAQLEQLLRPYLHLKSLRAQFVQKKHLEDLGMDLTSTGNLKVDKTNLNSQSQVLWTVITPSFLEVAIGGKELILTSMKNGAKQIQKISFEQMGKNQGAQGLALLLPWLEMNVDALLNEYSVQTLATTNETSPILFTPKSTSLFKNIQLTLAKDHHIKNLLFHEKTGDSIEIIFKATQIENFK